VEGSKAELDRVCDLFPDIKRESEVEKEEEKEESEEKEEEGEESEIKQGEASPADLAVDDYVEELDVETADAQMDKDTSAIDLRSSADLQSAFEPELQLISSQNKLSDTPLAPSKGTMPISHQVLHIYIHFCSLKVVQNKKLPQTHWEKEKTMHEHV